LSTSRTRPMPAMLTCATPAIRSVTYFCRCLSASFLPGCGAVLPLWRKSCERKSSGSNHWRPPPVRAYKTARPCLPCPRLAADPAALQSRILRQWLEQGEKVRDVGFHHLTSRLALSAGRVRGKVEIPGKVDVRREGNRLRLEPKLAEPAVSSYRYPLSPGQEVTIAEAGWYVSMTAPACWQGSLPQACLTNPWQAIFDAAALPATLVVRSLQPGDRIRPLRIPARPKLP